MPWNYINIERLIAEWSGNVALNLKEEDTALNQRKGNTSDSPDLFRWWVKHTVNKTLSEIWVMNKGEQKEKHFCMCKWFGIKKFFFIRSPGDPIFMTYTDIKAEESFIDQNPESITFVLLIKRKEII